MVSKAFSLFSFITVLVLGLIPLLSHARTPPSWDDRKTSPFGFLKHLQGCHKGDKVKGVLDLKILLESAVRTYQLNYYLNATGILDAETVSKIMMPRCGVVDIFNGTNPMQKNKKRHHHRHDSFHTVSHYCFFPDAPKFLRGTPAQAMSPIAQAFQTWAANTHFTFSQVRGFSKVDITIGFARREKHGDGNDFDGLGGTIAHAFAPTNGRFHFDADEQFSVGAIPDAFDYETIALHEIGHLLGLYHSSVPGAIMESTNRSDQRLACR
ncbi:hypothetical protein I3760_02G110400 [Carya illinoinensis]|nr:hypothetical protein I3760_02G110400 [Carya illinoinensis]